MNDRAGIEWHSLMTDRLFIQCINGCSVIVLPALCSGVANYGALEYVPPRHLTISFLVHFGVNLRANYPRIV